MLYFVKRVSPFHNFENPSYFSVIIIKLILIIYDRSQVNSALGIEGG